MDPFRHTGYVPGRRKDIEVGVVGKNRIMKYIQTGFQHFIQRIDTSKCKLEFTVPVRISVKSLLGAVTKETAVKPEYVGEGCLVLEPTYKYIILTDIGKWGPAGMTIEDGMFLACDANVKSKVVARKNLSSAVLGSEGLFNLSLQGNGVAALESNVPEDELIEVILENDELKIDGNLAVCWSSNLEFTVERSTKTLVGSAVSGEGLVNVYRGTGRILMCPVAPTTSLFESTNTMAAKAAAKSSNTFGK